MVCLRRALFAVSLLLASKAAYIPLKAQVAQHLLERAWMASRGGHLVRPWPWADTHPVARLGFPKHGRSFIVVAGATGSSLAFGPGHLSGSAQAGEAGNVVIAGHRDTHFRVLEAIEANDVLTLESADGEIHRYVVDTLAVRDESQTDLIRASSTAKLTLVTCWPFHAVTPGGRGRFVVQASLVRPERAAPVSGRLRM